MFALSSEPIDILAVQQAVSRPEFGAIVTFLGITRNHFDGRPVERLEYEAYPEMALPELRRIGQEIEQRWPGVAVAIVHRTGVVPLGEPSVVIAVGSPHRAAGYEANRYAIEALKQRVPIWKKEIYADGSAWKANAPT